jgi:hypothetical protein
MNDVVTLAMFTAKLLCLIVFVYVLKPDGSIGAVLTATDPADCTKASINAGVRTGVLLSGFASRRLPPSCTSDRHALLK